MRIRPSFKRRRGLAALLMAAAAVALAACAPAGSSTATDPNGPVPGDTIDGFVLGSIEACSPPVGSIDPSRQGRTCAGQQALAAAALDSRDPGHATVKSFRRFADGTQPGPIDVSGAASLPPMPTRHSGPAVQVFVFTLADGSIRATGVACADSTACVGIGSYPG